MPYEVTIPSVTANTPVDIYYCNFLLDSCVYVATVSTFPYTFVVPQSYVGQGLYIKIIDTNGCIVSDVTPTPTPSITPSITPSKSMTPTPGLSPSATPTVTPTKTETPTPTPTISNTPPPTPSISNTPPPTPTISNTPPPTPPPPTPTPTPFNTSWYFIHGTGLGANCTGSYLEIKRNGTQVVLSMIPTGSSSGTLNLSVGDQIEIRVDTGNQLGYGCKNAYAKYDAQQLVELQEINYNSVVINATVSQLDIDYGITICGTIGGGICLV